MGDTPRSPTISTQLQQIAEQARHDPDYTFETLAHLLTIEYLREAYRRTRKDSAPGIDRVTAEDYAENLEANLQALHARLRDDRYRATPVKRVWLEKDDGRKRPIGIPVLEDKIVQRAVAMVLNAIYEQDFWDCSYGFRAGRSPHQALTALREWCMANRVGWIVDADISGFFDNLDHPTLGNILTERIRDGKILQLIGKWLHAGVQDGTELTYPEKGTPQGGVISPLLANVFLHHVLDTWFLREVQPRLQGRAYLIRFADDFVIACERENDARRLLKVLPKRFGRFGLTLHPTKTQLIKFQKAVIPRIDGEPPKRTFDFLGFTHYWDTSRNGYRVIKRQTARKRQHRALSGLWEWCRLHRHLPIAEQYAALCQKLMGHYAYYGIRGNYAPMARVYRHVEKAWHYWLSRRSRTSYIHWADFIRRRERYPLPLPKIVHNI